MTIFILYAILEGVNKIFNGKNLAGAMLIAFAINIKILPIVLIPYLLYRSKIKASIYIILFYILFLLLPAAFIGWNYNMTLMKDCLVLVNPFNHEHLIDISECTFQSLTTLIPTLLMKSAHTSGDLHLRRNILDISEDKVIYIINISRILLILFTIYFIRTAPFKKAQSKLNNLWELSYILLITPLIFPHQQIYAFVLIFPAASYIIYFMFYRYKFLDSNLRSLIILMIIIFILTTFLGGIIGNIRDITSHYKLITYGALLLIVPLAMCKPDTVHGA